MNSSPAPAGFGNPAGAELPDLAIRQER